MPLNAFPDNLSNEERQEKEDLLYEEQVKASSNANLFFGLGAGFLILYTLISTLIDMRANVSFMTWLTGLFTHKMFSVALVLFLLQLYFNKFVIRLRFDIQCLVNYSDYTKNSNYIQKAAQIFKLQNASINIIMLGFACGIVSLFIPPSFQLMVRVAALALFVLGVLILAKSETLRIKE